MRIKVCKMSHLPGARPSAAHQCVLSKSALDRYGMLRWRACSARLLFCLSAIVSARMKSSVSEARKGQVLMEPLRHVLVIDDEQALLDLIGDSLQLLGGYTVMVAHDGVDG